MSALNEGKIVKVLDYCYKAALNGLPGSETAEELAADYLAEDGTLEEKIDRLIRWQTAKCATSGFISGLGGLITLPIAIPTDLTANYYVQLRMIAAIAKMRGYDVRSDKVRALAYICLCGNGAKEILKDIGVQLGQRLASNAIQKISAATIIKINQAVGFRLLTKFGEKGLVNLGRAVPLAGGLVGATINGAACTTVGKVSKKLFVKTNRGNTGSDNREAA